MRKTLALAAAVLALAALPIAAQAQSGGAGPPPTNHLYGFGHVGIFSPQGDIDHFDTGFFLQGGVGSRVVEYAAVEATASLYQADGPGADVWAVPITFGGRLFLPLQVVEPFVGAGFGLYIADFEGSGINDTSVDLGYYLSLGLDAWLSRDVALSVELRRHFVEPELDRRDVDIGGWTFGLGARFLF